MDWIRRAKPEDVSRIAEIEIFNYRLYFYPIFKSDAFYFGELQVLPAAEALAADAEALRNTYVYDDGVVKGFIRIRGRQVEKLFVEPHCTAVPSGASCSPMRSDSTASPICGRWKRTSGPSGFTADTASV